MPRVVTLRSRPAPGAKRLSRRFHTVDCLSREARRAVSAAIWVAEWSIIGGHDISSQPPGQLTAPQFYFSRRISTALYFTQGH